MGKSSGFSRIATRSHLPGGHRLSALLLVVGATLALGCEPWKTPTDVRIDALAARLDGRLHGLEQRIGAPIPLGRYQIVNPVPSIMRGTMLLDTATGHTWQICQLTDNGVPIKGVEGSGWCEMTQANGRGDP
jgi:hypothetical protein